MRQLSNRIVLALGFITLLNFFSAKCLAGEEFDLSEQEVVAVSSLENSTSIAFDYPNDDPLSTHLLSLSRGALFCQSKGYEKASQWTYLKSFESKEFTVYETTEPSSMRLPVVHLIEFIDRDTGDILTFGQKMKLPPEEAIKYKKLFSKKAVPHLLFEKITCEE